MPYLRTTTLRLLAAAICVLLAACVREAPLPRSAEPFGSVPDVTPVARAVSSNSAVAEAGGVTPAAATPTAATPTAVSPVETHGAGKALLLFTGDVMLGRGITPIRKKQGNGYPLAQVAPFIHEADLSFANLESPLTNITYFRGGFNLRAEPGAVQSLALAGFDWVSVANNHSGDHGRAGMVDTLNALRSQNIAWAGGGETEAIARRAAFKSVNGLKIALLAYDGTMSTLEAKGQLAGSQRLDPARAAKDIQAARAAGADIVIVAVHWGIEYAPLASPGQKQRARELSLAGADLVIGSHPHVVEPLEWIKRPDGGTTVVAYSLGNFVFDQWFSDPVMQGVMLRVVVDKQGVEALNLLPTRNFSGQVRVQPAAAAADEMVRLLPSGALPIAWRSNAALDSDGRPWWHRPGR